ncbi:anosmin-1-like isoform X2 [Sinocyclocheilus grahami]|uniref:anosmin-1-like isoform X2 n=1 Tax=Sinocyclocheilus grahami TaxID=75366 RepID=UPI0007AC53BC|nr:PREDICTED: anosmin-1-like isoform X2 [Sinocyclocheilus grahami]
MVFMRKVCCFLLCCVFEASVARRTEEAETLEKTESARCVSRCLTLHITQITALFKHLQNDRVLDWCEDHRRCSQCLQPCKELWETRRALSPKTCEKHHECVTSAEFLRSLRSQKQGDCPPPQRASGFAAACVEGCAVDRECSGFKKCCSNGCGHTCQSPANLYRGVPLKPRRDISFSEDQHGHLKVRWMSKFNVSVEPVLYVLLRRWNHGIHPSEDDASAWHTVLMTMEDRSVLKDIRPHRWYQFRVSAVNSQGTRGFTTPSKHFFSVRDPFPPETPQNARIGNQTVHPDGTVSVLVLWEAPGESDLVVHHYKVTWSTRGIPPTSQSRAGRVTDRDVTQMELQGLQPNTHYTAQIQAISYWGQNRLKSNRAHLSFITAAATSSSNGNVHLSGEFSNEIPVSHSSPSILRLEAAAPHYHDNQLQVKVFWKSRITESQKDSSSYILRWFPEVCAHNVTKGEKTAIVQGTHFVITGLLFACKYRVAVKPVTGQEQRSEVMTSVTTPLCSSLMGRRKKPVACVRDERPPQGKKGLQRPEKLAAWFQPANGSVQAVFSWQVSPESTGQTPITGFQLSWLKVSRSRTNGMLVSQTHLLPPDQRSLTVDALQPQSEYRVQLQVLSGAGHGPSVSKTLHTPHVNGTLL